MRDVLSDIRFTLRSLTKSPAFALAAIATLALGIGATTAMFSVVDGVLLRPLPYADADRIVAIWQHDRAQGEERDGVSAANFLDWRDRSTSFSHMAAIEPWGLEYTGPDGPEDVSTSRVSEGFFEILRTPAALGRTLQPQDYAADGPAAVVIAHGTWQNLFGGDSTLVGRPITLDGTPTVVVGVMPPEFNVPPGEAMWVPRLFGEGARQVRAANYYAVVARMRPDIELAQARAEMDAVGARLALEYPETNAETGVTVVPLDEQLLGDVRTALLVLLGAVGFVLVIASVNVANLLLVRGAERRREFAIRTAMGAGHGRLSRQLLTENVTLALLGGVAGILLAYWGVGALLSQAPEGLPRVDQVGIDQRVLAFALAVSLLTALLFGVAPAMQALKLDLRAFLTEGGRGATAGRRRGRFREAMVVVQLGLALILLSGTGLMVRSFVALVNEEPGYRTENVLAITFQAWRNYPDPGSRAVFVQEAVEQLAALPGVRSAGMTSSLPLSAPIYADEATFVVEGRPAPRPGQEPVAKAAVVTSDYFATLGIPLVAGRLFAPSDDADAPLVAVISEAMARRYWPGEDPIGERVSLAFAGPPVSAEIIGIVGDVRHHGLDAAPRPSIYVAHAQAPTAAITFVVRTAVDPRTMLDAVKQRLWSMNSQLAVAGTATLEGLLDSSLRERRFYLFLLVVFSVVAGGLAVIGTYGLMSFVVRGRTSEISIRMALGAQPQEILRLYAGRGATTIGAGLLLGLAGTLALTRILSGLLYGVEPTDPLTLVAMAVLLGAVAFLSAFLPARRATRVEPAVALKMD